MRKIIQIYSTAKSEIMSFKKEFDGLETTALKVVVGGILFAVALWFGLYASLLLAAILKACA
jgi:hypothetical protein